MTSSSPTSSPASAPLSSSPQVQGAVYAVVTLTLMNLLNYIDRYAPSAVKERIKEDLHLTDAQTSYPLTAFIIVYMIASPIFGTLAERYSRKKLIAFGVAFWSLATAGGAMAQDFTQFIIARGLVGIGEAAYATIAPSMIADYYPPEKRNRILTIFYVAIPVGSALGFGLGGLLGDEFGWRAAFMICGLPGLAVALLALFINEAPRGQFDVEKMEPPPWKEALPKLLRNRQYIFTVAGYTAVTFAMGGIADWFPAFLERDRGMAMKDAGFLVGVVTVVGGLGGTVLGGLLADRVKGVTRQAYLAVSGLSMLPAVVLCVLAIYVVKTPFAILGCVLVAQICLWMYNSPVNTLIVNSVDVGTRVRAFGLSIFSIHVLGDALSPSLIGKTNEALNDLPLSMSMVPVTIALAGVIWIIGWRVLPEPKPT